MMIIRTKKFRIIAILTLSLFLLVCSKVKNPVTNPDEGQTESNFESVQSNCKENSVQSIAEIAFESLQGECKTGLYRGPADACADTLEDSVLAWFSADTVWVMHKNAFENCCSGIVGEVVETPEGFDVFEQDTSTELCYCMCYFDIVTTIHDVCPGSYLIRVFDIGGNFVGQAELVIPSATNTVIFSAHGDTIFVTHQDASYQCCAEIAVDVVQTAAGFDLFERDTSAEACDCICDFDINTTIFEVSEGEYLVRLFDIYGRLADSVVVTVYGYVI